MEIPIYETLEEFKEYYLDALAEYPELKGNKIKLLREYQKMYKGMITDIEEWYSTPNYKTLIEDFKIENHLLDSDEVYEKVIRINLREDDDVSPYPKDASPELRKEIDKVIQECEEIENSAVAEMEQNKRFSAIKNFIDKEIENEKSNLLRFQSPIHLPADTAPKQIEKGFKLNYKIAILERMEVIKWLDNNIPTIKDRAEIIAELIGGSPSTIEDYLDGKNRIKTDIQEDAIKFINSKIYK